jgi:transposase
MLILYYFYLEISARKAAKELKLDYETIQSRFMQFRKLIADYCNQEARKLNGELELDESYFGGKRKGNRGRGAANKT